jgi:transcriptional regulator NrdR family protein
MIDAGTECPFCRSSDVEVLAAWGGQLITRQVRCRSCNAYFEALRDDFDRERIGSPPDPGRGL